MDQAYEEELRLKYKQLWTDYKLAVTGAYFCNQSLSGAGALFAWEGPHGIKASAAPPLQTFLAAPTLDQELAAHLSTAAQQH